MISIVKQLTIPKNNKIRYNSLYFLLFFFIFCTFTLVIHFIRKVYFPFITCTKFIHKLVMSSAHKPAIVNKREALRSHFGFLLKMKKLSNFTVVIILFFLNT